MTFWTLPFLVTLFILITERVILPLTFKSYYDIIAVIVTSLLQQHHTYCYLN